MALTEQEFTYLFFSVVIGILIVFAVITVIELVGTHIRSMAMDCAALTNVTGKVAC
jgi:hypothetical protein